ncbi:MAG: [Clostridia bacterium]|nr:[FeFe] hydrogenase H-cluster radical SAM maturase HydE [Clostridia bacterium]
MIKVIEKLFKEGNLQKDEIISLLECEDENIIEKLFEYARIRAKETFGNEIYTRGLIEISNFCKNDCYYCGIRRGNKNVCRYRLSKEQIMECCQIGYDLDFRSFVLQGGEDPHFSDDVICDIVSEIRKKYPDCAITLSLGERSYESYKKLFDCGANRYLLRHETSDFCHYGKLHPKELSLENRIKCLENLKKIGYQVGTGIMVGSPYQTIENIADDIIFIKNFKPHMIGLGPFVPHKESIFRDFPHGSVKLTLKILAILRLMLPKALIPATTALGTVEENGREMGILAGANVLMPNLSPKDVRKNYLLYDNKISTGEEAAEGRKALGERMEKIGYILSSKRGDYRE